MAPEWASPGQGFVMKTNYRGHELIEERVCALEATLYNHVCLNLKRMRGPLNLKLPRVVYIRMSFDNDTWWCLDHSNNDRPLFAWTGFDAAARQSLDAPVPCRLLIFSPRGEEVLFEVLRELPREMAFRLRRESEGGADVLTPFRSR